MAVLENAAAIRTAAKELFAGLFCAAETVSASLIEEENSGNAAHRARGGWYFAKLITDIMAYGLGLWDFLLYPFYMALILGVGYGVRNRFYPVGHAWRPYFIPGLLVKLIGATLLCLVYTYYYNGGDTTLYFMHASVINEAFDESMLKWFRLLTHSAPWYDGEYMTYTSRLFWYEVPNNYIVGQVGAVAGLISFNTYLNSSLFFAAVSFTGMWAMFRCFAQQYPDLVRHIAIATLFVPSLVFWGSGMAKDTICIFGLGWMIYLAFRIFFRGSLNPVGYVALALIFLLVYTTKIYIIVSFVPAMAFWLVARYSKAVPNKALRTLIKLGGVALIIAAIPIVNSVFKEELAGYDIENAAKTSEYFRKNMELQAATEGGRGSFYSLGEIGAGPAGMLQKAPLAIAVTLYGPLLFQVRNPLMLLSALESTVYIIITLMIFFRVGGRNAWSVIRGDPNVQFFLVFTLIFAFACGITTFNFGTLSRYKIPCMPTFALALAVIYKKGLALRLGAPPEKWRVQPT